MLKFSFILLSCVAFVYAQKNITLKSCTLTDGSPGKCVHHNLCEDGMFRSDTVDQNPSCRFYEACCDTRKVSAPNEINSLSDDEQKCGLRNSEGVGFRIAGYDDEAENGEFPWMVAILGQENDKMNYLCGGSLLTPSVVLTAAHCVNTKNANSLKARVGEWHALEDNLVHPHADHVVEEIIIHENFYKGGLHNDIALLFLREDVKIFQHVNTICLPTQNFNSDLKRCIVTGWGRDGFNKFQAILKKVEVPIVSFNNCQNALRSTHKGRGFSLHTSFMCAGGEPGKDACKGDGGSPLVCEISDKPGHYYQAGIVAWGIGCGENGVPGVYVDVAHFREWIDQQLVARNLPTKSYIF